MKYTILLLLFCFLSQAQETDFRNQRKGKLFFKVGVEYRITPLPNDDVGRSLYSYTSPDSQNSGAAVFYGFKFFATKNLSLGFSHTFRYALLNFKTHEDIPGDLGHAKADYSLMMGYHLYIDYHFKVFKNAELFARFGISLSNRNSNYTYKKTIYNQDGSVSVIFSSSLNYNMQPKNYAIGYKKNKLEVLLGVYATNDAPYFNQSTRYIIPYINLNYRIGKL